MYVTQDSASSKSSGQHVVVDKLSNSMDMSPSLSASNHPSSHSPYSNMSSPAPAGGPGSSQTSTQQQQQPNRPLSAVSSVQQPSSISAQQGKTLYFFSRTLQKEICTGNCRINAGYSLLNRKQ